VSEKNSHAFARAFLHIPTSGHDDSGFFSARINERKPSLNRLPMGHLTERLLNQAHYRK